jgi:translation initiation factor 1
LVTRGDEIKLGFRYFGCVSPTTYTDIRWRCVMTKSKTSDSPFASLEKLREGLPVGPEPKPVVPKGPARAVVRMERKGRGGKEATVIEKLGLSAAELETWCRELKQALGCGGVVDGDAIVLQGDLRTRLPAVLTKRGVAKVTVG